MLNDPFSEFTANLPLPSNVYIHLLFTCVLKRDSQKFELDESKMIMFNPELKTTFYLFGTMFSGKLRKIQLSYILSG